MQDIYAQKMELANIRIVKDVATVAMAALALISLFFASFAAGLTFIPAAMLGLSCIYIVLKISAYFYDRTIKDQETLLNHDLLDKV